MSLLPGVQVIIRKNDFNLVAGRVDGATRIRMRNIREEIADLARHYAPVDTGFLREHIQVTADGVISLALYSIHQEYGTYKMAAHPFLRPAIAQVLPRIYQKFEGFEADLVSGISGLSPAARINYGFDRVQTPDTSAFEAA